jgi:hypothetical protein
MSADLFMRYKKKERFTTRDAGGEGQCPQMMRSVTSFLQPVVAVLKTCAATA